MIDETQKLGHKIVTEIKAILADKPDLGSIKNVEVTNYSTSTVYRVTVNLNEFETLQLVWDKKS